MLPELTLMQVQIFIVQLLNGNERLSTALPFSFLILCVHSLIRSLTACQLPVYTAEMSTHSTIYMCILEAIKTENLLLYKESHL